MISRRTKPSGIVSSPGRIFHIPLLDNAKITAKKWSTKSPMASCPACFGEHGMNRAERVEGVDSCPFRLNADVLKGALGLALCTHFLFSALKTHFGTTSTIVRFANSCQLVFSRNLNRPQISAHTLACGSRRLAPMTDPQTRSTSREPVHC
jgi:hypothetical protein